jgi:hypothetical protein
MEGLNWDTIREKQPVVSAPPPQKKQKCETSDRFMKWRRPICKTSESS